MENKDQVIQFIHSRIGLPYNSTLPNQDQLIFSQMIVGALFIRGYRMMVKNDHLRCCTFYKRSQFTTEYLYLKFLTNHKSKASKEEIASLFAAIKAIDDMKCRQQPAYRVVLGYLEDKSFIELDKLQFSAYSTEEEPQCQHVQWAKSVAPPQQGMMMTGKDELVKLKDVVWTYINTFGTKYKNNYYCDLEKRNPTPFNIEKLINTVNWIIYCQTADKPYNQIETANWTCFERRAKEKLKPDRKDILLSGSARSLMIHLLLLEKIENYQKEYENEVNDVILEFRKSYIEGEVKAYEISDELEPNLLVYKSRSVSFQRFPVQ